MEHKKFTTSAQKTTSLSKESIIQKLKGAFLGEDSRIVFTEKNTPDILQAKLDDGSKIIIAAFDKTDGKSLAMIDHKDLPGHLDRRSIQMDLRKILNELFD